jgi:phosphoglycerate dehydrogenase-like enzyme
MRVAVLDDYQHVARDMGPWDTLGPDVEVDFFADHVADDDALVARLEPYEAVVAMRERTPFGRARLERLPNLRLLVTTGMGNASIDVGAAAELGIVVSGTGSLATPTAELTWGLILALTRSICAEDRAVRAGGWQHTIGPELSGRTLGVLGLGRLGSRVAGYGRAFGMRVLGWSEHLDPGRARELGVEPSSRDDLLSRADIATIHLRLSERTRGLIGARELELLGPESYLVNTSRGPIVDEAALLAALHSGEIAGAGLDVYDVEPLPDDHPLRRAPRTVLSPHLGYVAADTYRLFYTDAVEDIEAWRAGSPVRRILGS